MKKIVPGPATRKGQSGGVVRFRHLAVEDGLPSNSVRAVLQDRQGFIWFATEDGLARFDGYGLRVYRTEPGSPNSLGDRTVFAMLEDDDGCFWIGLSSKLDRFDPRAETFTHYPLPDTVAFRLCRDRQGAIWVGTLDQGLYCFDPSTEMFIHYPHDPLVVGGLSAHHVRRVMEDWAGNLWVVTEAGLDRLDRQNDKFVHYAPVDPQVPVCHQINWFYQDTSGRFWAGTEGGLRRFDPDTGQFATSEFDPASPRGSVHDPVTGICADKAGRLWVATAGGGLNLVDLEKKQVTQFLPNPADPDSLIHDGLWCVYADREGNIWVGTIGKGVDRLCTLKFAHYKHDPSDPSSLRPDPVTSFCELAGEIWVANGDLCRFDRAGGRFTRYVPDEDEPDFAAICRDREGYIWGCGGAAGNGLARFDPRTDQMQVYRHDPGDVHSLGEGAVQVVYEDRAGQLWVGTEAGLDRMDRASGRFEHFIPYPGKPFGLDNSIQLIYEGRAGVLWLGGWHSSLVRFDPRTLSFTHYHAREGDPTSLSGRSVLSILEDRAGRLWVGTASALDRFDPVTETFIHYTEADGLPSSVIRGLLEDDEGRLWISTMNGLSCFDPQLNTFKNYDAADGLQSNQFMYGACLKSANGDLYFGGVNGFNVFSPKEIQDNPHVPPIVLTDLLLFNKPVAVGASLLPQRGIWATDEITLGPEDYVFAFEFAALSYVAPSRNGYRYKLEGFDPDWNQVSSRRRFAAYSNLRGGEYRFCVVGSNNDDLWSQEGVSLKIRVTPPMWEKLKIEKETAEAANRAKSAFLANMSHELRTPLTAILGFAELMAYDEPMTARQRENLEIIRRSGEHLLGLINDVLDLSRIEAGKASFQPQAFDLHEMLLGLGEMFSLRAEQKGLTVVFELAPGVPRYIRADEGKLRQVLINLLGNAVKFTEKGSITLRVASRGIEDRRIKDEQAEPLSLAPNSLLHFSIQDTGIGIAPAELDKVFEAFVQTESGRLSQQGTGLGLAISRQCVRLMGGDIAVQSEVGKGSCFRFDIQAELPTQAEIESLVATTSPRRVVGLEAGQQAPDGGPYRLLVAEDVEANRELLVKLLRPLGFEVREAADGQEVVEICTSWHPHLIWMDMRMPVLDGYEATRRVKAASQGRQPVVVALTASPFEEERTEILAEGCDGFLRKPFREAEIFDTLSRHLGIRFVYEEWFPAPVGAPATASATASAADEVMLKVYAPPNLPAEWATAMRQAVVVGDMQQMLTLIDQIGRVGGCSELANRLMDLVYRFEHREILSWLDKSGKMDGDTRRTS